MANGNGHTADFESALDLLGFNRQTLSEAFSGAEQVYNEEFGERPTRMSPDEQAEHLRLAGRFQDLSTPRQRPQAIRRQPVSEFSLDPGGLHQGIIDLVGGIQDAKRRQELFGDPDQQSRIADEINQVKGQVSQLREQAKAVREGEMPEQALRYMEADDVFRPEVIAEAMETEAERLEADSEALRETLIEHGGVAAQYQEAEREREERKEQKNFKDQFITTFGQRAAQQVEQRMQRREELESMERRTEVQARAAVEREEAIERRQIRLKELDNEVKGMEEIDAEDKTPNRIKPRVIQQYSQSFIRDTDSRIKELEDSVKERGWSNIREALQAGENPPELNEIRKLQQAKRHAEDVRLMAIQWQESTFEGGLPPQQPPQDYHLETIDSMLQSGVDQPLIEAYRFYNRISEKSYTKQPSSDVPYMLRRRP